MDEDERPHRRAYAGAVRSSGLTEPRTAHRWRAADLSAGPLPRRPAGVHRHPEPEPPREASASGSSGAAAAADVPRRDDVEPFTPVDGGRLLPALLAALFCFPPTGVAAVNQTLVARDRRAVGDLAGANAALGHARRFAVVSLILGALLYLAVFLIAVAVGAG